ncbi:hypothetical protein KM800_14590 [Clostridium tyrobutyricum]|uniref:hypothetical protein n=1 Tax=Clostridium tyrobutyricum TaxID=1519 RepID=UPI001C395B54|nr:hypothetical protein [Clostridium tyrobutyricum]MBV4420533.1 hypothetical protein [Clostridium tyrobutyricum]
MSEKKSTMNKHIENIFNSIDNIVLTEKEQKLRVKLGTKIYTAIFTDDVTTRINIADFSDLDLVNDKNNELAFLFSTIFPVFIKQDGVVFRLYKHKIEVDLSDSMADRYLFMFSDGRMTSGLFECFRLYDDEYIYGVKRIIKVIPLLKQAVIDALDSLSQNNKSLNTNITDLRNKVEIAKNNYKELLNELN